MPGDRRNPCWNASAARPLALSCPEPPRASLAPPPFFCSCHDRHPATPYLREDLLTPRSYTTEIEKAARTSLAEQRQACEALLGEMQADYNRDHFDRKAPLNRLRDLSAEEKEAYESYLVRSCVSKFSGFLLFKELSRWLKQSGRPELGSKVVAPYRHGGAWPSCTGGAAPPTTSMPPSSASSGT